jgi:hypothetical protein
MTPLERCYRWFFRLRYFFARHQAEAGNAQHNADHIWHVWINHRQDERRKHDPPLPWEHSLYEFKNALNFLEYGHGQLQKAFTGTLRKTHRQCSRCAPEPIPDNKLQCCLGQEVTTCPILLSLKSVVEEQRSWVTPYDGKAHYANVTNEHLYRLMARTCAWHIYHDACGVKDDPAFHVDTSEGYLTDKSDRMFWDNVCKSLSYGADVEEQL